jgi:hypothetical protein
MPPQSTREELVWALCSVLDGTKEHDLHCQTGLPEDACALIWGVYIRAMQEPCSRPNRYTNP